MSRMRTDSDWPGTGQETITVDQDMEGGERAVIRQARPHTTPVPWPSFHSRQHHQTHKHHKRTTKGPGLRKGCGTNITDGRLPPAAFTTELRQADRRKTNENKEMTNRNPPPCPLVGTKYIVNTLVPLSFLRQIAT